MEPFLLTVATQLHQRFQGRMHELAVVFPNRRQSVFFNHYLKEVAAPPCFLPQLMTIEEMVAKSSALEVADNLTQGFALYEAFAAIAREENDTDIPPFDVFYSIGETILKDFREIDSYLVNIEEVCRILYDIEAIDKAFDHLTDEQRSFLRSFWEGARDKGNIQEKFLKLWERLPRIYQRFHEILASRQLTTMGAVYRQLAGGTPSQPDFNADWAHVAFVGFNAFNKSEETLLQQWNESGYASIWLDADAYYFHPPHQEAGYFLRRNQLVLGLRNELPLLNQIAARTTPIEVIAAEGQHAQAKMVEPWWQQIQTANPMQAGILLADESLLLPVLQSLPQAPGAINITMGYPLQQSPVYSMLRLFFDVHQDAQQHRYQTVHHSLVNQWLQHPFCNWPPEAIEKLQLQMLSNNLVRVPLGHLQEHSESAALLFSRMMADGEVFQRLRQLLEAALQQPSVQEDAIAQGLCVAAWKTLQQLEPLFASLRPAPDLAFMGSLLMKQMGSLTVPFEGEPLQGVQLMGLLESRGLDFDHLIILGASEGSLPRIKPPDSFLPDNVRRAFGLPIPEHQDAIFAYVFYRLLHRAKTIRLVYNALVTDNSTGEESRFVQQLQFESGIPVHRQSMSFGVAPAAWPQITIPKDEQVMSKLRMYYAATKPITLSPSAINTYLNCRLQFFFRYIAGLREPEEVEEGVDAAAVGSVVHKLMELLLKACQQQFGKHIGPNEIAWMQAHKEDFVEQAFKMAWKDKEITGPFPFTGELHVVKAVVLQYAELLLQTDAAYAPFRIEHMEVKFEQPFAFRLNGRSERIILKGYIDRVDEKDGVYRMVDYKTGSDNPQFKNMDALFERDGKHQNKAALQTLIYSWMFHRSFPQHTNFEPALLAVRHLQSKGKQEIRLFNKEAREEISHQNIAQALQEIEQRLRAMLEELFNPQVAFDQTSLPENCNYCDFRGICGRG